MYRKYLYLALLIWLSANTVTYSMVNLPECSRPATALSNRERRIATIRAEFTRQQARGVKSSFIIADLAYRYFMTESTIQSIVWKRGRYGVCSSTANALSL